MSSTTSIPTETAKACDFDKVQVGSVFSRHSFGKVILKTRNPQTGEEIAQVENSNGEKWTISAGIVENEFSFADQFDDEEKVSRTRCIEILTDNPRTAMTINYRKKPDAKKIAKETRAGKPGAMTVKDWDAMVKELVSGELRTMVGYHSNGYDEHRRLRFNEAGVGQRLVDPRTLEFMVVDRVKYVVGK